MIGGSVWLDGVAGGGTDIIRRIIEAAAPSPDPTSSGSSHSRSRLVWSLVLVWLGVAGRAVIDKLLALQGGGELVAANAQLGNVIDLVAGVSMSGLGVGVTALVAQAPPGERAAMLRATVWLSALTSGLFGAAVLLVWGLSSYPIVPPAYQAYVPWAVANGVIALPLGLWSCALVGLGQLRQAVGLNLVSLAATALALGLAGTQPLAALLGAQTLLSLGLGGVWLWRQRGAGALTAQRRDELLRFVPAGLSIGLLSPLSLTVSRLAMAEHLGWNVTGQIQALWRTTEWVTITVSGVLSYYFLPRLSEAVRREREGLREGQREEADAFSRELRHANLYAVLPAMAALALLWTVLPTVQAWLYTPALAMPRAQAMPYVIGDAVRLLSWVYLFALYARASGRAIAIGELLSLPLFATALVVFGQGLGVAAVGWLWAGTFTIYAAFNWLATPGRRG